MLSTSGSRSVKSSCRARSAKTHAAAVGGAALLATLVLTLSSGAIATPPPTKVLPAAQERPGGTLMIDANQIERFRYGDRTISKRQLVALQNRDRATIVGYVGPLAVRGFLPVFDTERGAKAWLARNGAALPSMPRDARVPKVLISHACSPYTSSTVGARLYDYSYCGGGYTTIGTNPNQYVPMPAGWNDRVDAVYFRSHASSPGAGCNTTKQYMYLYNRNPPAELLAFVTSDGYPLLWNLLASHTNRTSSVAMSCQ